MPVLDLWLHWRLRQGLWLVAKEGLVPIRGQSPTLAGAHQVPPHLLLHPVLDVAEAPTRMAHRKVVHPAAQDRVDHFDHLTYRLALAPTEELPEFRQYRRPLFQLRSLRSTDITPLLRYC